MSGPWLALSWLIVLFELHDKKRKSTLPFLRWCEEVELAEVYLSLLLPKELKEAVEEEFGVFVSGIGAHASEAKE